MTQTSRRVLTAAVFCFALVAMSFATEARQGTPVDPALKQAAEARTTARQTNNPEAYVRYTLDDALITNPAGVVVTTKGRLEAIKTAKPRNASEFKVSDDRYRTLGDATVRTYREDGVDVQGQKGAARFMEIWVKRNAEWKLAAVQVTPITQP